MTWQPMRQPCIDQLAPDLGQYLTALCRESGRTQADIGAQLGMHEVTFRRHLNGKRKTPCTTYLVQYAIESIVGAGVVRKVRKEFGMRMPRS